MKLLIFIEQIVSVFSIYAGFLPILLFIIFRPICRSKFLWIIGFIILKTAFDLYTAFYSPAEIISKSVIQTYSPLMIIFPLFYLVFSMFRLNLKSKSLLSLSLFLLLLGLTTILKSLEYGREIQILAIVLIFLIFSIGGFLHWLRIIERNNEVPSNIDFVILLGIFSSCIFYIFIDSPLVFIMKSTPEFLINPSFSGFSTLNFYLFISGAILLAYWEQRGKKFLFV
jgi:hypothetical protein